MSNFNFKLILDQYLIIEQDSNLFLVYTKSSKTDSFTIGLSNGIQVWSADVDASTFERFTKINAMGTDDQQCISYLLSSFTSKNIILLQEPDGQTVNLEFGPLKVPLKLKLQVSNSVKEIQRLLFELAKRSTKLQDEVNKHEKVNSTSPPKAFLLYPPSKLKPIENSKARKSTPGMSVINPRSKKIKNDIKGVAFSDT